MKAKLLNNQLLLLPINSFVLFLGYVSYLRDRYDIKTTTP
jgi:hypothetical protein